jgi:hypothetical protein
MRPPPTATAWAFGRVQSMVSTLAFSKTRSALTRLVVCTRRMI